MTCAAANGGHFVHSGELLINQRHVLPGPASWGTRGLLRNAATYDGIAKVLSGAAFMRIGRVLGLPLVCLALAAPASASPIELLTSASWVLENQSCSSTGTTEADCTRDITYTVMGFPQTRHVVAESSASFGQLALAFSTVDLVPQSTAHILTGSAAFADELLLTGGSGAGYIQYVFTGRIDYSTESQLGPTFQLTHDGTTIVAYSGPGNASVHTALSYMSPLLPFNWDETFAFSASLEQFFNNGACCSTQQDLFSVGLSEIRVFDVGGSRLSSYSLRSGAQATYATTVPEPATFAMLAAGLLPLLARRARGRRSIRP
jgi:hypothetical protein